MSRLKLEALEDDTPVKLTLDLPAAVHRDLIDYGKALAAETGGKVAEPARLIVPMLVHFMRTDRSFMRGRKGRKA
jgi:hypothetical protein